MPTTTPTPTRTDRPTKMQPTLTASVPGAPRGQGSMQLSRNPATGKEFVKYSRPTVDHRNLAIAVLQQARGDLPTLTGAVAVKIDAWCQRPRSHYGTGRNAGTLKASAPTYVTTPPDIDKICRLMLDACTIAGVWEDDAQVAVLQAGKAYVVAGTQPYTTIRIWSLI